MELKTLWFCMGAAFLVFGMIGSLKPDWFLSCAWTLSPHHITPETIAHLRGASEAGAAAPAIEAAVDQTAARELDTRDAVA